LTKRSISPRYAIARIVAGVTPEAPEKGRRDAVSVTQEIAARDWGEFLREFTRQNQGRPVRLETAVQPGEGSPVIAEHSPLLAVDFEVKGSEAPAIMVTVGGTGVDSPHLTHVIHDPRRLWSQEDAAGLSLALDIDSTEEGKTLLLFEPELALPAG
jgi:hypothetical protein